VIFDDDDDDDDDDVGVPWWRCTSSCRWCPFVDNFADNRRHQLLGGESGQRLHVWHQAAGHTAVNTAVFTTATPPIDHQWCGRVPLDAPSAAAAACLRRAGRQLGGLCSDGESRINQQRRGP